MIWGFRHGITVNLMMYCINRPVMLKSTTESTRYIWAACVKHEYYNTIYTIYTINTMAWIFVQYILNWQYVNLQIGQQWCTLRKKVEPKRLHPWSHFMVRNLAPPMALWWNFPRWNCCRLKKRSKTAELRTMEPKFFSVMIMKEKKAPPSKVAPFSKTAPGWSRAPLFSQC